MLMTCFQFQGLVGACGGALSLYLGNKCSTESEAFINTLSPSPLSGVALAMLFELFELILDLIENIYNARNINKNKI